MTTLLLQSADTLIGGVASAATSAAGRAVTSLFGGGASGGDGLRLTQGPRLVEMSGLTSTEGAAIPRLYGRARLGGQLIWATRFEEIATTTASVQRSSGRAGGKSLGGGGAASRTTLNTTYSYVANLAVGLCEGPIGFVRRVWADGREVDLTAITMRVHRGDEDQAPDPLIVAKEGADAAPAYRGLAYAVFERLPLGPYGNRVPQFSFEAVRPVGRVGAMIRSVCLVPGATEFGYDTEPVLRALGLGASLPENVHQLGASSDVEASLDALAVLCPNLANVSLVVSWFGTDLRCGQCRIQPRVDLAAKAVVGPDWSVGGLSRVSAVETSRAGGVAAYGGTPSDASVLRLIAALKARGWSVTLYPFVMMDVPAGNGLPDPWSASPDQPAYPWRGRITCDPAPGRTGTADATATAATQVGAFFGSAAPADFGTAGGAVTYAGPDEWSFRRFVLHQAKLAVLAGGVDAFVVGSELVGLTRIRSAPGSYPAVGALRTLAADLRFVLGAATKLVYAADWTEYGAHVLAGGAEVRFPLDPLWADSHIDAVGIDFYAPLSDWRDGGAHADAALARSPYDVAYLRDRSRCGEAFDWFYADDGARAAQTRSPIGDGAYGKPWTFRAKDLVGWWSNPHVERVGGAETSATAWAAGSKPIWLTEIGVPAVDKGANAPNCFPDPKSSSGQLPPFSSGARDDLIQARALEALLSRFDPAQPGHVAGMNPVASAYPGRMVDPSRVSVWCWDARPFPAFPDFASVWADGPNWEAGHWLTGRLEGAPIDRFVAAILADHGLEPGDTSGLDGFADGYVIDRPMSARAALEPLAEAFGFDAGAASGGIAWRGRGGRIDAAVAPQDLAEDGRAPLMARSRAQETDLPASVELGFTDAEGEYARAAVGSRKLAGSSRRQLAVDLALVTRRAEAERLAEIRLQDVWAGRETAEFALSPRALAIEPGDVVAIDSRLHRVTRIVDGAVRRVSVRSVEPASFAAPPSLALVERTRQPPPVAGAPFAAIVDLPATGQTPETLQHLAVAADPWPGAIAVWRSPGAGSGFDLQQVVGVPAIVGRTLSVFPPGPVWRWDDQARADVEVSGGSLAAVEDEAALAGANLLAILGPDGSAEIVSAAGAELIGPRRYRLSRFLRGLGGTEDLAARTLSAGATVVRLDGGLVPVSTDLADIGRAWTYRIGPASRDHSDPSYVELVATVSGLALAPLSPVQLRARRGSDGVALSWVRRTRVDGDGWELSDVPLGEESEAYAVDILSGGATVRSFAPATASVLYAAADELVDFGAPQAALALRIAQLSRVAGRGRAAAVTLPVM